MSEVSGVDILDAMRPASPLNSRFGLIILDQFSYLTSEQTASTEGRIALEYAISLGSMATTLGFTDVNPPSMDGPLDKSAKHVFGSEIKLFHILPPVQPDSL